MTRVSDPGDDPHEAGGSYAEYSSSSIPCCMLRQVPTVQKKRIHLYDTVCVFQRFPIFIGIQYPKSCGFRIQNPNLETRQSTHTYFMCNGNIETPCMLLPHTRSDSDREEGGEHFVGVVCVFHVCVHDYFHLTRSRTHDAQGSNVRPRKYHNIRYDTYHSTTTTTNVFFFLGETNNNLHLVPHSIHC